MASFEQQQQARMISDFVIGRTLGSGMSGKVRLGTHAQTGQQVALKLIRKDKMTNRQMEMIEREISVMSNLKHPNTTRLLHHETDVTYTKKDLTTYQVILLVIELCPKGELFDYLMHTGPFSEDLCRAYFAQFLGALEACHLQGVYHRDLKPENLFLDAEAQLRLADFGLAATTMTDGAEYEELLETECGTKAYMCPEMLAHQRYAGSKADIWSAGVVLFIMATGHPPFQMAVDNDWWFHACKANRHDRFWAAHLRTNPNLSQEFQDFISRIFQVDPQQRATIEELKGHAWFQGAALSAAQIKQEMEARADRVAAAKEAEKARARAEKAARAARGGTNVFARATHRKLGSLIPPLLPEDLDETDVYFSPNTAEDMITALEGVCGEMGAQDFVKKADKCKMKANFAPSAESGSAPVQVAFQIYLVPAEQEGGEAMCTLHAQRRAGDVFEYQKVLKALLEKAGPTLAAGGGGEGGEGEEAKADTASGAEQILSEEAELI